MVELTPEEEAYERGYLQALRDLKIVHETWIDAGAGFENVQAHKMTIRFLDGLIATKEARSPEGRSQDERSRSTRSGPR